MNYIDESSDSLSKYSGKKEIISPQINLKEINLRTSIASCDSQKPNKVTNLKSINL